jgi:geranylgeranyl diphosphate synthase type II
MAPDTETYLDVAEKGLLNSIETALKEAITKYSTVPRLREAIEYALLGGGKRLRPVILIRACEAAGGRREDAMPAAVAIEIIHTFSLVHDDLPCMDDDDLRRGRTTLHKAMGEDLAILAGDAMQPMAIAIAEHAPIAGSQVAREILEGTKKMIEGQVLDTVGGYPDSLDARGRVTMLHELKTAALFVASCRCGALIARAPQEIANSLDRYGQTIGLMFQVVDDLIDETQSTEHIGKTAGKDRSTDKLTYPSVFGLQETRNAVMRLQQDALDTLNPLGTAAEHLRRLARYLALRTK